MPKSLFGYIWRNSFRQQIIILAMTISALPFYYFSLDLPKQIVNDALGGDQGQRDFYGYAFGPVGYLLVLCFLFLILVLINGAFKYVINVYKGVVGERMLRRARYELIGRVMRFPPAHFRKLGASETSQMITAEVEPLGGFIGDAFSLPAYQGGMLLTTLLFLFVQNPLMGLAAVALYPLQMYVIPKLQWQVNLLGRERVRQTRRLAERVGETVMGQRDIVANDASLYERAQFSAELATQFYIRFKIYNKKFFIKFLNNFIAQLTPFFFYSIGGYLVLTGELTLGALVAALAAHDKLYSPWKELLTYYQSFWDTQIKYEQVVAQFDPPGIKPEARQTAEPPAGVELAGELQVANLGLTDEGQVVLDGVSFRIPLPARIAVVGPGGSGKGELALLLGGLLAPSTGRVLFGEHEVERLPESVLGRAIGFAGNPAQLHSGTIRDNLLFGLKHRPVGPGETPWSERDKLESERSANSPFDWGADWLDLAAVGVADQTELLAEMVRVLRLVRYDADVYALGLRRPAGADVDPEFVERILAARAEVRRRLAEEDGLAGLVEPFDRERYNDSASLAENLLFGLPLTSTFAFDRLADQPYVQRILRESDLLPQLYEIGYHVAETMIELFADLPPDHEYFRQFSFIDPDELPDYKSLIGRIGPGEIAKLGAADRARLLSLSFQMERERHRLGLIDDELAAKVVTARERFRAELPDEYQDDIAFFDPAEFNGQASLQDNILFGKIAYGRAQGPERVSRLLAEIVEQFDLREHVISIGLLTEVGIAGNRLSAGHRQKIGLARAILKKPTVLIADDAAGPLDPHEQDAILSDVLAEFEGRTVIWVLQRSDWAARFDRVVVLRGGRLVEVGAWDELDHDGSQLRALTAAE